MSAQPRYYLFTNPSFLEGMARVLDLGGTLQEYNRSETEAIADARAIQDDWRMTGKDIKIAIDTYAHGGSTATTAE